MQAVRFMENAMLRTWIKIQKRPSWRGKVNQVGGIELSAENKKCNGNHANALGKLFDRIEKLTSMAKPRDQTEDYSKLHDLKQVVKGTL